MKALTIQKLMGVGMIVLGVLSAIVSDGDCTAGLLIIPMGLILIISKQNLIGLVDENEYIQEEQDEHKR